jgi:hypothetical protein
MINLLKLFNMKRTYQIFFAVIMMSIFASCEDFMDIHKEYIKDGEIIYAPKIDSMVFIAGQNRIQFRYWLYKSPNVRSVDLYWNDGLDSLIIPVTPTTGIDSLTAIIPNLEEKSYTFTARTTDLYGHKSLYATNFGTAYGELFESTLSGRRINSMILDDNRFDCEVSFFSGSSGLQRTEVRFKKANGEIEIVPVLPDDGKCSVTMGEAFFETRSLYIPEAESVDTFATAWVKSFPRYMFLYDRSTWEVLEVSDETASDGGGMHTLLDDDLGNFWHSQWDNGNAPLPHWVVIDMKEERSIAKLAVYRRQNNGDSKSVVAYVGDSPDASGSWRIIGGGSFTSGDDLLEFDTDDSMTGRYFKLVLPDSNKEPFTSIAEIYFYGSSGL